MLFVGRLSFDVNTKKNKIPNYSNNINKKKIKTMGNKKEINDDEEKRKKPFTDLDFLRGSCAL